MFLYPLCAVSLVEERYLDTVEVTSSSLVSRTISSSKNPFFFNFIKLVVKTCLVQSFL